eukprot:2944503-Prymnesium_polylepis.1
MPPSQAHTHTAPHTPPRTQARAWRLVWQVFIWCEGTIVEVSDGTTKKSKRSENALPAGAVRIRWPTDVQILMRRRHSSGLSSIQGTGAKRCIWADAGPRASLRK